MYMSSSRHYATIIEKAMKADVRIISQGGWGVYSGWDNDVRHQIPAIYELTEKYKGSAAITIFRSRKEADDWLENGNWEAMHDPEQVI